MCRIVALFLLPLPSMHKSLFRFLKFAESLCCSSFVRVAGQRSSLEGALQLLVGPVLGEPQELFVTVPWALIPTAWIIPPTTEPRIIRSHASGAKDRGNLYTLTDLAMVCFSQKLDGYVTSDHKYLGHLGPRHLQLRPITYTQKLNCAKFRTKTFATFIHDIT